MSSFGNILRCNYFNECCIFQNDVTHPLHFNFFYKFDKYLACVSASNRNYSADNLGYWSLHSDENNKTLTYLKYFDNFKLNYLRYEHYHHHTHNALIPVQYPTDYYIFVSQDGCKLRIHRKDTLELIEEKNIPCGIANIRAVYPSDTFAYIYSYRDHNIKKVDYFTQTVLEEFGGYGNGSTTFKDIVSIAYNGKYIYLADEYNNRILIYNPKQNYTYVNTIDFKNVTGLYADSKYLYAARQAYPNPDWYYPYIDLYVYDANTFEEINSINGLKLCNNRTSYNHYSSVNLTKKDDYLYIGLASSYSNNYTMYAFYITQVNGIPIDGSSLNLDFNTSIQMYDINHHLPLNTIPDMYAPNLDLKFGSLEANLNIFNIKMELEPHLEIAGYHEFITASGKILLGISGEVYQMYKPNMKIDFNLGIESNQVISKISTNIQSQINCINTCPIVFDNLEVDLKKSVFYNTEEVKIPFEIRSVGGHFENIASLIFKSDTNQYYNYALDLEAQLVQGKLLNSNNLSIPFDLEINNRYTYNSFNQKIPVYIEAYGVADSVRVTKHGIYCEIDFTLDVGLSQETIIQLPNNEIILSIDSSNKSPDYCEG